MLWHRPLLIVNPKAGRIGSERPWVRCVQSLCADRNVPLHIKTVAETHDTYAWASHAAKDNHDLLIVAGGDGTMNQAVTGLKRGGELPVVLLPTGSGNVLAKTLGIPLKPTHGLAMLEQPSFRSIDLGFSPSHQRYLLQGAAIGPGSELFQDATQHVKNLIGFPAYFVAALKHVVLVRTGRFHCTLDGNDSDVATQALVITNTDIPGLHLLTGRAAVTVDDGVLDVLVLQHNSVFDLLRVLRQTLAHPEEQLDTIFYKQAKNIVVRTDHPVPMTLDGEVLHGSYLELTTLPKALRIVVPARTRTHKQLPRWLFW